MSDSPAAAVQNSITGSSIIADHNRIKLEQIPLNWASKAIKDLHIAYGHSSHGSQITYGLLGLTHFRGMPFIYRKWMRKGSLDLRDNPFGREMDLGNPDNKLWADKTQRYLEKNKDVNVVMWSWCGQLSKADDSFVKNYLDLMSALEVQFPAVKFIYMTGHLDGSGETGVLARNNGQIREFCLKNYKVLYDFADIESYDPDGVYFGDRYANGACGFDSDGDRQPDRNWGQEWQKSHNKNREWYECRAAHTEPINANMKAYAFWWLLARAAGWDGVCSA